MDLIATFANPEALVALLTLTVLEIVLGIDNVIFISILVQRLPPEQRDRARYAGLGLAMGLRILLLLSLSWIIGLTEPALTAFGRAFAWRDLILIGGGLFLLWKATTEIHDAIEADEPGDAGAVGAAAGFGATLLQIVLLDIVFSLDSVLTAVGLVDEVPIMIAGVIIAVGVMLVASGPLSAFVHEHPTVKMLALSFLLVIGITLVADGFGLHIDKAYIYAAMGFSVFVEALNLRARRRRRGRVEIGGPAARRGRGSDESSLVPSSEVVSATFQEDGRMETKNLADLYELEPVPWSRALDALGGKQVGNGTSFLATTRPDGRPHLAGVGAIWHEGKVWIVSGPATRKSQNLAANPDCSIGMSFEGMDLVIEGRAERVTDGATLERVAARYADDGWPARVEDGAFTYDYSAPSAGPPPWYVYAITPTTVYGVLAAEPGGATRWRFDD